MTKEKNILLTSLGKVSDRFTNRYYYYNDNNNTKYCDGVLEAEAGAKYILSKVNIDEIVVLGSGATYVKGEELQHLILRDWKGFAEGNIEDLSEYSFFRYRLSEYLDELNFEWTDLSDSVTEERKKLIVDKYHEFNNSLIYEGNPIRLNKAFHALSQDETILEKFKSIMNDLSRDEYLWLKNTIFNELSDNFKLSAMESNNDLKICFIPTVKNTTKYEPLQNIKGIIDAIVTDENQIVNIYMDMQGLVSSDGYILLSILSMLSSERHNIINIKEIITTHYNEEAFSNIIDNNDMKRYEINKLVSGLSAFIQYGKVELIKEYWNSRKIVNKHIDLLIYAMEYVDQGISLCNVYDLERGINLLKKVFSETSKEELPELESNIFMILERGIKLDYGALLDDGELSTIELVKWAYRKKFYQQTITIIESKIPSEFVSKGIMYYAIDEESKNKYKKYASDWYYFNHPKDRWKFEDPSHYFIKSFGRDGIKLRNKKDTYNDVFIDRRMNAIYEDKIDKEIVTRTYTRLIDNIGLLRQVYLEYINVGVMRNKINHAENRPELNPNDIDTNEENVNIKLFKDQLNRFISVYEKTLEYLDGLNDNYNPIIISKEEMAEYFINNKYESMKASEPGGRLYKFKQLSNNYSNKKFNNYKKFNSYQKYGNNYNGYKKNQLDDIAVLIPCYNEAVTIAKVVKDFKIELPNAKIYVYDNNSTDGSDKIARECGAIVRYEKKQGKGNVVRTMFRDIDAKCYVIVDADDTYSLSNVKEMCDKVLNGNVDMVVGDRLSSTYFKENKRPFHNFGNKLVLYTINKLFKSNIRDIMTGFRTMSYEFVKTFPIISKGFEIETEMTIHAVYHNMNIENVIIDYKDRPKESPSKLNTISDGIRVIKKIFSLYKDYKPMEFFSLIAVLLFILSTIFVVPIVTEYVKTGLVPRIPTLVVCVFVYIMSILSFFTGLILSTVAEKDRRDFENNLQMYTHFKKY